MKSFTFQAYDQKWWVRVEEHAALGNDGGVCCPDVRTIFISPQSSSKVQKATLLHEIIHLIEHYWDLDFEKHKVFGDLEVVGILEEGIIKILRDNNLTIP